MTIHWPNNPHQVRILIADDDRMVRRLLHSTLRGLEHTNVTHAESGEEAMSMYHRQLPNLVFLDIAMPGKLDGMAVLDELRSSGDPVFIVMITAHGTAENVEVAIKKGVNGFLVKPFTAERIHKTLENFHKSITKT